MMGLDAELKELGIGQAQAPKPELKVVPRPLHPQWDRCKTWIDEGLGDSMLKIADLEAMLISGQALFWPGKACALVTEITTYPTGERAIEVLSAGGDMAEIMSLAPGVEAFARLQGCTVSIVEGRKGWERTMRDQGYAFYSIKLRKEL